MKFARILMGLCMTFGLSAGALAANFTVTKTTDTNDGACDADCSLREAVAAANQAATNDAIYFALPLFSSPQTITLALGEMVFANNGTLTIYGTGANRLTISGGGASRIFATGANVVAAVHHMKLTGGNGAGAINTGRGGAIYNVGGTLTLTNLIITGNSANVGGATNNAASSGPAVNANMTVINCFISNNTATSSGAAMQNFSTSTMSIINSTVWNNSSSTTGIGGAIMANGTVSITNSTVSHNSVPAGTGGGVYFNGSALTMTNVTIANNSSGIGGGGLHRTGTTNPLNVRNTIIAYNTGAGATPDAAGLVMSQGNNIVGNIGTSTGWIMSDLTNQNPLLGPLGFYGGIGYTRPRLTGSPAINGGQNCVRDLSCAAANPPVAVTTDERGAPRTDNVDIGAFEVNESYRATLPSALVNQPYNQPIAPNATGFGYTHSTGTLPPGLTIVNGTNGSVSVEGTPTQIGNFNFGIIAVEIGSMNSALTQYRLNVLNNLSLVPVSGRITDASGLGIPKTTVVLTDQNGNSRTALTNGFGYFYFGEVPAGGTFVVSVASKQYTFAPQTITVTDAYDNLNLSAATAAREEESLESGVESLESK